VTALELLLDLGRRGVRFAFEGDRIRVVDPECKASADERGLLRALVPELRALLRQRLPDRRGDTACDAFEAADGVALCERCAFGIAEHFWRRIGDCTFFFGSADEPVCRRCGVPQLEHLGVAAS